MEKRRKMYFFLPHCMHLEGSVNRLLYWGRCKEIFLHVLHYYSVWLFLPSINISCPTFFLFPWEVTGSLGVVVGSIFEALLCTVQYISLVPFRPPGGKEARTRGPFSHYSSEGTQEEEDVSAWKSESQAHGRHTKFRVRESDERRGNSKRQCRCFLESFLGEENTFKA